MAPTLDRPGDLDCSAWNIHRGALLSGFRSENIEMRQTNPHRRCFSRAIGINQPNKVDLVRRHVFVFDLKEGEYARMRVQPIGSRRRFPWL